MTNRYIIELNSKTAKIDASVTPFIIEYTKYRIPTKIGGNFLYRKLNNKTATSSIINKIVKESSTKILKYKPEE